jgi:signal transduction histidine kinase
MNFDIFQWQSIKIIAFDNDSITRRLYLHTAIVATFLLAVISVTIWAGNTLTMITAISRFERTHTVSRVEAMLAFFEYHDHNDPDKLKSFHAKIAITQSYNMVFSRLLDMRKDTPDAEFVRILESTFSETDHKTALIIVNRIKVLYWNPILKALVADAGVAHAAGEKLKAQAAQIIATNNDVEQAAIFAELNKTRKEFILYETSFSKNCSALSNQISSYVSYITIALLFISVGFTGLLTYLIARTVIKQGARYSSDLEKEIEVRTLYGKELQQKNAELERFTYTVSHDLKSPIITIKGFTGSLEKDLANGRYERMTGDLKRVNDAADKMNDLLRDLLELSTVGRVINAPEVVDMNLLAADVLAQLAGPLKNRNLTVAVQPDLPEVLCDKRRMAEVLQNLLENAVNYIGKQAEPQIQLGMREEAGENIFFVEDNGIGIDEKYHQIIFGLFNKLDAESEGTGVGLALVKRIIEVHGGRVWVESEGEGKGSRFCFTIKGAQQ